MFAGHKFIGAPVPCGVVVTRKQHIANVTSDVEYLNSRDATIMGSRNGHAALYLWYALSKKGMNVLNSLVTDMFERIALEGSKLVRYNNKKTLSSQDIQTAVKLLLPADLGSHAIMEASKAIAKFNSSK